MSTGLGRLQEQLSELMTKLNTLPLEESLATANATLDEVQSATREVEALVASDAVQALPGWLHAMLTSLEGAVAAHSEDSGLPDRVSQALIELQRTLERLRALAGRLEQDPNALIFPSRERHESGRTPDRGRDNRAHGGIPYGLRHRTGARSRHLSAASASRGSHRSRGRLHGGPGPRGPGPLSGPRGHGRAAHRGGPPAWAEPLPHAVRRVALAAEWRLREPGGRVLARHQLVRSVLTETDGYDGLLAGIRAFGRRSGEPAARQDRYRTLR